jgi:hypothetical protein
VLYEKYSDERVYKLLLVDEHILFPTQGAALFAALTIVSLSFLRVGLVTELVPGYNIRGKREKQPFIQFNSDRTVIHFVGAKPFLLEREAERTLTMNTNMADDFQST